MKLRPLSNHVIVKAAAQEEMTKSGIVLPGSAENERPEKGEIIAVGPGKQLENGQLAPMNVKIGDQVVFKKYSPDEIKIDGEEYLILEESDIVAIID
ncbi:co-chaperone GroES [Candidatus Falkowbacteria bacterium HGW-Falkowbacteria-2]|uniref:Co-chaperonin GroES n=1 Tax=Candidatus Falkowbacteria bacterium HGW-Falkowbacteria-2 TaxID=2013769 RepID=A0A2N2DZE4_9BACT|nr:MAG: co-chaperone GroES [Candidatus Falkowbacteria bacterium HGW-Falkowbacteria-2]